MIDPTMTPEETAKALSEEIRTNLSVLLDNLVHLQKIEKEMMPKEVISFAPHGFWIEENKRKASPKFICPFCREIAYYPQPTRDRYCKKHCPYKYCPNCGELVHPSNLQNVK